MNMTCSYILREVHIRLCHKVKEGFAVMVDGLCLALHFLHIL